MNACFKTRYRRICILVFSATECNVYSRLALSVLIKLWLETENLCTSLRVWGCYQYLRVCMLVYHVISSGKTRSVSYLQLRLSVVTSILKMQLPASFSVYDKQLRLSLASSYHYHAIILVIDNIFISSNMKTNV